MAERRGTKGLELWCRKMTEGYPGVKVENMTTSWRDGLAFCAIIHHFRPDLIDFDKLNKDDIYHNNELAFRVAEHHLGIPALLEAEDMEKYEVPDRLSILTYLSQFYQTFADQRGKSAARTAPKRTPSVQSDHGIVTPESTSPPSKVKVTIGRTRREPCSKCQLPVFIAERLNVGKLLYHRTCFRCARCNSQLTLGNYYETENEEYCCEICPDEEKIIAKKLPSEHLVLSRSMSDEEKSANLNLHSDSPDAYSAHFESSLESPINEKLRKRFTIFRSADAEDNTKARSEFIKSQITEDSSDSSDENSAPNLPESEPPPVQSTSDTCLSKNSGFPTCSSTSSSISINIKQDSSSIISDSVNEQTNHHHVTKDNFSNSSVKARRKLFENINEQKSDVNRFPASDKVPLDIPNKKLATVVAIDDLEDFDNVSKKDVEIEERESSSEPIMKTISEDPTKEEEPSDKEPLRISPMQESTNKEVSVENVEEKCETPEQSRKEETADKSDQLHIASNSSVTEPSDKSFVSTISLAFQSTPTQDHIITSSEKHSLNASSGSLQKASEEVVETAEESKVQITQEASPEPMVEATRIEYQQSKVEDENTPQKEESSVIELPQDTSHLKTDTTAEKLNISEQIYPTDLNPFGDDDESPDDKTSQLKLSTSLNPFGEPDDDEEVELRTTSMRPVPAPRPKKKLIPSSAEKTIQRSQQQSYAERISKNPFDDDDDDDDDNHDQKKGIAGKLVKPIPSPRIKKKKIAVPYDINLNPFGDDDDEDEDDEKIVPVPKPRGSRSTPSSHPEPRPRDNLSIISRGSYGGSTSSISSGSAIGSSRKKKPAPRPPIPQFQDDHSNASSLTASPIQSLIHSPHLTGTIRSRKLRKAPLPPSFRVSPPSDLKEHASDQSVSGPDSLPTSIVLDREKIFKDEQNRSKQLEDLKDITEKPCTSDDEANLAVLNKSSLGRWKRKKGQAPSRPIPQKRTVQSLPMSEIRRELDTIEIQQQGLERQGVRIEQIIREKCEGGDEATSLDSSLPIDVEDLILQLFELVNEKNELFRRQAELMYLRRQQRLEEEYADVEYQIRCLMVQPEANKTDTDKTREDVLISRLVEIVERRNEIIECLEMDRVREAEEDSSISSQLNLYSLKRDQVPESEKKDKKKKHKKLHKLIHTLHRHKDKDKQKTDAEKVVDESETGTSSDKKKKKKFNLF